MKKILFTFLCVIALIQGRAQTTFAPVGAEWHYIGNSHKYDYWSGNTYPETTWNDHVVSLKDTTYAGQSCRKLEVTRRYKKGAIGNNVGTDEIHVMPSTYLLVYNNADTVFYFDQNADAFLPLYIWNAPLGDTLCLPHLDTQNAAFCFTVDSVVEGTYDTSHLKSYYTNTTNFSSDPLFLSWYTGFEYSQTAQKTGLYIERLGGIHGLFPSRVPYNIADGEAEIGYPAGALGCYSDSSTFIKMTNMDCDSIPTPRSTNMAINSINESGLGIGIYPSPAVHQVNIQARQAFEANSWLEVTDILGKTITNPISLSRKQQYTLDVSRWANGTYFLKFKTGGQLYYQKITVLH